MKTALACPACNAKTFDGSVCSRCGYAAGETMTCPHCAAVARVENGKCLVCGGPRVPSGLGGEDAANALREAKTHLGVAARRKALAAAFGVGAVLSLLFTLGVAAATGAIVARVLALAITCSLAEVAVLSFAFRRAASKRARAAEERAWLAAAEDVAKRRVGGVTAEELGSALAIEPARAERLLTELAVHERTRIDVGDDAEVRYSVGPGEDAEREREAGEEEEAAKKRART